MKKQLFTFILGLSVLYLNAQDKTINGVMFKQDGKLGIGITNPLEILHVNGSVRGNATGGALRISSGNGYIDVGAQNTSWAHLFTDRPNFIFNKPVYSSANIFSSYNDDLVLQTEGVTRLTINDDSGNVGIGTTTPEYKFHVTSGVKIRKSTFGVTIASNENSWVRDEWLTGSYGPAKWEQSLTKWVRPSGTYNDVGGIVWQDEGTYFIRIGAGEQLEYDNYEFLNKAFMFAHMYTGNVGIGTISPDEKLSINGNIHTKEVRVDLIGWSDFVFKDDYNLPTLQEVESHIKDKGHLKDIPSAKEVAENGILLGEMDAKLLQKIEELMLYTIEQQKQIEIFKKELRNQKYVNESLKERLQQLVEALEIKN